MRFIIQRQAHRQQMRRAIARYTFYTFLSFTLIGDWEVLLIIAS
jgi:hypothetical protein